MKKIFNMFLVVLGVVCLSKASFAATSVDALLEKLVEKGTFTKEEARKLKGDIASDEKLMYDDAVSTRLPDWVKTVKLKGDLRLRYQYEKLNTSLGSRSRGRTRFRMGVEVKPIESTKVMAGFASGGTDPRSTNVTWENTFERPDLRLDYAAVEYTAAPWAKVVGGKFLFPDYLWQTTDMLWDTDINPYGFSANLSHDIVDHVKGFANGGLWIIDENNVSKRADPTMTYLQGGVGYQDDKFDAKTAATWYTFNAIKGIALDNTSSTNTLLTGPNRLKNDYDSVAVSAEFGAKNLLGGLPMSIDERIAVFGDYISNPDPSSQNIGWASGIVIGNAKVGGMGQWQLKYQYVYLGKDAFPDTFPDSDRLGGRTDVISSEGMLTLGLLKNVSLGIDYYHSNRNKGASNPENIIQSDLVIKF